MDHVCNHERGIPAWIPFNVAEGVGVPTALSSNTFCVDTIRKLPGVVGDHISWRTLAAYSALGLCGVRV